MKKLSLFLVLAMLLSMLAGCAKAPASESLPEDTTAPATTQEVTEAPEESEETTAQTAEETQPAGEDLPEGSMRSHLTGKVVSTEIGNRRPAAIMINNIQAAIPQTGISRADVMYECMVEGSITRMMGLFENYDDLDKIGPVRSARTYFVYLAGEWNAVYLHFGQCDYANLYLSQPITNNLNGVKGSGVGVYYRTTDRKAPHNAYTSAKGIETGIEKQGYIKNIDEEYARLREIYNKEIPETYTEHFKFAADGETVTLEEGFAADYVYSGFKYNDASFEYNEDDGLYYRFQYGAKHIDTMDNKQLSYDNLIIMYSEKDSYYGTQYLQFDLWSDGDGYYITKGKAIPIRWIKDTEWGPMRFEDKDGNQITMNQGKTFISVVPTENEKDTIIGKDKNSNEIN